jgi:hypothetical protein
METRRNKCFFRGVWETTRPCRMALFQWSTHVRPGPPLILLSALLGTACASTGPQNTPEY